MTYTDPDDQFQIDEDHARRLRQAPRTKHNYPITDDDRRLGQEDIRQAQQRYADMLTDLEHYELEDLRRQYPPIPLCDTLINEDMT